MEIVVIAAMAANRVIGRDNRIPWAIPGELARFREVTMGHPLVMGRRTHESIGRPLDGRRNIVISRNGDYRAPGCEVYDSLGAALAACGQGEKIFIIGGGQLYRQALPLADRLILTELDREVSGDTRFPRFSETTFRLISTEPVAGPPAYTIKIYERVSGAKAGHGDQDR